MASPAEVPRHELVDVLRKAGVFEVAELVESSLPDPVNCDDAAALLALYGITRDSLISRLGGSP
jgi:hypothetical protein